MGDPPASAKVWREKGAVLDEWNHDGYMVIGQVTGEQGPKAVLGTISEQAGGNIPGQYLSGGAMQAYMELPPASATKLRELGNEVIHTQKPAHWIDPTAGMSIGSVIEVTPGGQPSPRSAPATGAPNAPI